MRRQQLAAALRPAFAARSLLPPLPEVYELIAEAWSLAAVVPRRANLAVLDEGVSRFPRRLELVDRIIERNDGRVRASGTHAELMELDGWYARQWRLESERRDMSALLADLPVGRGVAGPAAT